MNPSTAPILACRPEFEPPVLRDVSLKAVLEDLMAQVEVRQDYVNCEPTPIEAVYTFPVPRGAVLLSFTAKLGGRELAGRILPAPQAEDIYEEAVAGGDGAILLQEAAPGLYTVNVGNLLPGEEAVLTYRYAQLQYWQGGTLRFALPTVLAPRYGDPASAGMQPHQAPRTAFMAHHQAQFRACIRGALQEAEVTCPTHAIRIERQEGQAIVSLEDGATLPMDRDLVLNLRRDGAAPAVAVAEPAADGRGRFVLLSCCPDTRQPLSPEGRFVKILVDCSGSMAGDSIEQARVALRRILDTLRPQDSFSITAFGSTSRDVTAPCVQGTPAAVAAAREAVATIDAYLGGTELGGALLPLLRRRDADGRQGDVLLVTDGEVFDGKLVAKARKAGGRVFAVGVGCAPGESLLGDLADATGGAAEFVTPGDDVAARIHRHFQRLLRPRVTDLEVQWPEGAIEERRDRAGGLFAGDTLHILARLPGEGDERQPVVVRFGLADGTAQEATVPLRRVEAEGGAAPGAGLLERLLAAAELREAALAGEEPESAERDRLSALAVRCRLLSPWTACVMVADRDEASLTDGQPALRKVAQMLPAGWGGTGSGGIMCKFLRCDLDLASSGGSGAPRFSRRPASGPAHLDTLRLFTDEQLAGPSGPWTIVALEALGVPAGILDGLRELVAAGHEEEAACALCLKRLLELKALPGLGRDAGRQVRRDAKSAGAAWPALGAMVAEIIARELPAAG